jgi:hypothetical protein
MRTHTTHTHTTHTHTDTHGHAQTHTTAETHRAEMRLRGNSARRRVCLRRHTSGRHLPTPSYLARVDWVIPFFSSFLASFWAWGFVNLGWHPLPSLNMTRKEHTTLSSSTLGGFHRWNLTLRPIRASFMNWDSTRSYHNLQAPNHLAVTQTKELVCYSKL